ncbi:MAG: orotate phosphoribosyltransferase [Nitrosopumilus sp.]|nr:orotate phosphoribosyltransferase [Nitrosopumilus sp.]
MTKEEKNISIFNDIILFLHKKEAIKTGDFVLSSGKKSKFYLDLRILQSYPIYFRKSIFLLKHYIIQNIGLDTFEYICSIPTSGTVFGSTISYDLFKPHIYIRKNIKNYGTQKTFEGDLIPNSKILFIDDVITTGNSLISSINILRNKFTINEVLVFVDREQGAAELMRANGIKVHKIISMSYIFETLYSNNLIGSIDYLDLKNELEKT